MRKNKILAKSFKATIPVMAGYLVLGCGFGLLLQSKGYDWWWAALMSFAIYAGSMQYVAINLLTSGATLIATAIMTLMVNFRHLFYGIAMIEKYKKIGKAKPYLIFGLTDETFSLVCERDMEDDKEYSRYCFYVTILNQVYWVLGSIVGGLIGNSVEFNTAGIDFAMTALFVVIFMEQWEKTRQHVPAITGVVISVVCLMIFGASSFLIPAMIGIAIALFIERAWLKEGVEDDRQ